MNVDVIKGTWESSRIGGNVALAADGMPSIWAQHVNKDLLQGSPQ